jgi:dihydroflavonol-4-reductase
MASKRAGELHAIDAAKAGQHVVIVNPTTVFGPGDWSLNGGTLFKQVATANILPIPCGGTNVVDVIDVVEGILAALRNGRCGERYILGAHNLRYRELLSGIGEAVGRHPISIPLFTAARLPMKAAAWLVHRLTHNRLITPQIIEDTFAFKFFSCEKAERQLGWRPRRDLRQTLADAWAYYRREDLIPAPRIASQLQGAAT